MSKYGKNGTAWKKAVCVEREKVVDKIVIDDDFRKDMSELDREIFRLECSVKARMNTKVKGVYYGKKRGIVRTGRKELYWNVTGAFGRGISEVEIDRRELVRLHALKLGVNGWNGEINLNALNEKRKVLKESLKNIM